MAALLSIPLRTARTEDDSFSRFFSEPCKIKAQNYITEAENRATVRSHLLSFKVKPLLYYVC